MVKRPEQKNSKSTGVMPIPAGLRKFINRYFHDFFCDGSGQLVVAQKANLPLKIWFFAQAGVFITWFVFKPLHPYFVAGAIVGIGWWAIWEIIDGVCPWRRTLGFMVYNLTLLAALNFFNVI